MGNGQKQMGHSTRENQTVEEKRWANLQAERDVIGDLGRIHNPSQSKAQSNVIKVSEGLQKYSTIDQWSLG